MGNQAVATQDENAVATYSDNAFTRAAAEHSKGSFKSFAGFNASEGTMTHGKERTVIEPGTQIVIDMEAVEVGFQCWKGGRTVAEYFTTIPKKDTLPAKHDLPDHGPYDDSRDGWSESLKAPAALANDGTPLELSGSSNGFTSGLWNAAGAYGESRDEFTDSQGNFMLPVYEYSSSSYYSDKYRKDFHNMILELVDWMSREEFAAMDAEDEDDQEVGEESVKEDKPTKKRQFKRK